MENACEILEEFIRGWCEAHIVPILVEGLNAKGKNVTEQELIDILGETSFGSAPPKSTSSSTSSSTPASDRCVYLFTRGEQKGNQCVNKKEPGRQYCSTCLKKTGPAKKEGLPVKAAAAKKKDGETTNQSGTLVGDGSENVVRYSAVRYPIECNSLPSDVQQNIFHIKYFNYLAYWDMQNKPKVIWKLIPADPVTGAPETIQALSAEDYPAIEKAMLEIYQQS